MASRVSGKIKLQSVDELLGVATLFNAPSTISGYYQQEVNHDYPQFVAK